jgi:hypothetical protein
VTRSPVLFWPETPLVEHAVRFGAKGIRVFPCRGKEPAIRDNLRLAAVDETVIRNFWGMEGRWNIAIATGPGSGFWATDEDGEEGLATMSRLEAEHGKLPATVEVITGGGGRHLYWKWPEGVEIRNFQCRDDLPGFDVRGEGGYIIAPPSIHPLTGKPYAWSVDSADAIADAPDWLIRIATERSSSRARNDEAGIAPTLPEIWRSIVDAEHSGSHRSSAIARLFGHFVRRNVDAVLALHFAFLFDEARNTPPLGRPEVRRICDDIANREADRRERRR